MSFLFILSGNKKKASSRVRGYWVIKQLIARGHKARAIDNKEYLSLLQAFLLIPFYNTIVFQKTYSKYHVILLKWSRCLRKKTVLDIDDAPSRIGSEVTLKNFKIMVKAADLVTAGSTALLNYINDLGAKRSVLIPSTIDLDAYKVEAQEHEEFTIGWIGNGKDYKNDLITIVRPVLMELGKTNTLNFLMIGVNGASELYDEFNDIPNVTTEFIDQLNWSDTALVSQQINRMDVGLYPLIENDFNSYKCAFKALEYMACGIPVVSSDVAFNKEVIENEVDGFIVESSEDWLKDLKALKNSQELRTQMGTKGRQKVENKYNSEVAAQLLLNSIS